ncbi:MAG: CcmD family protein [Chloroflexota bacterium]|nr:CcmD family protein [Chloroflexota bacterium]MDP6508153.1 CcmD family protein [Chloroflexota bacterium]MDP6758304.1 CcmD family protein [Chloroflexota bacterium]
MNPDEGLVMLLIGYGIVWAGVFSYLVYAVTRLRSVERELRELSGAGGSSVAAAELSGDE